MRLLLDECVNEQLRQHFLGHECQTARYAGFAGLENGELLEAAEAAKFEVLLTVDRGFEYQQNLAGRRIALIVFCGKSVLFEDLLPLILSESTTAFLQLSQPSGVRTSSGRGLSLRQTLPASNLPTPGKGRTTHRDTCCGCVPKWEPMWTIGSNPASAPKSKQAFS